MVKLTELHIGDQIRLKNGVTGEVVALFSYSFLNDKIVREAYKNVYADDLLIIDIAPFMNDNVRHRDLEYYTVVLKTCDKSVSKPIWKLIGQDVNQIKEVIVPEPKENIFLKWWSKIKQWFKEKTLPDIH